MGEVVAAGWSSGDPASRICELSGDPASRIRQLHEDDGDGAPGR
jgi:hypothetical protein